MRSVPSSHDDVCLVQPDAEYRDEFLAMVEEYRAAGDERYQYVRGGTTADFAGYVRRLEDASRGLGLHQGYVPQTTFWLVRGRRLLGVSRLRHHLTPSLEVEGGHIGYDVRPSERRKGYGTLLLALTLPKARELGIGRVLVTCDADNVGSARIIQKNGGRLVDEVVSPESGKPVSRYWIELECSGAGRPR